MRLLPMVYAACLVAGVSSCALGEVVTAAEHNAADAATGGFKFSTVPPPAKDDLAAEAKFTIVDSVADRNGPGVDALHDGKVAGTSDDPGAAFFFGPLTTGGRVRIDLGAAKSVGRINTYSWHTGTRAPQVYKVYVADGGGEEFDAAPKMYVDPALAGWRLIATVDTRPKGGDEGGQYGVSIGDDESGSLGSFRYVLFDISRTEPDDEFGNTFFSEIDVIAKDKTQPMAMAQGTKAGEKFKIVIDTTGLSPEMAKWANDKLQPVCREWYPKLVKMLPSDGFSAPRTFIVNFKTDMGGTPAYANGNRISCNIRWFEKNKDGEGLGAVVHEMVHVVQQYKFGRKEVPFWLQEGIPDYIRWYLYEPEKNGTRIRNIDEVRYDGAYRVSANFLNFVVNTYDKDAIKKVNAALRQGKYTDAIWKELTGRDLEQLDKEWKVSLKKG